MTLQNQILIFLANILLLHSLFIIFLCTQEMRQSFIRKQTSSLFVSFGRIVPFQSPNGSMFRRFHVSFSHIFVSFLSSPLSIHLCFNKTQFINKLSPFHHSCSRSTCRISGCFFWKQKLQNLCRMVNKRPQVLCVVNIDMWG